MRPVLAFSLSPAGSPLALKVSDTGKDLAREQSLSLLALRVEAATQFWSLPASKPAGERNCKKAG